MNRTISLLSDGLCFPKKSTNTMTEEWKDIPGFERLYQASTLGRIRTCEGKTTRSARFEKRVWKQRIMCPKWQTRSNGRKDAKVELWKGGAHKTYLVARLVALTWCDGYAEGLTVNHIDGDPTNNRVENLEWVSLGDNIRKGFETGLYPQKAVVLITPDGERMKFRSMSKASEFLGHGVGYLSDVIKKKYKLKGGYVIESVG